MGSLCYAQSMNILKVKTGDMAIHANVLLGNVTSVQHVDGFIRVETDGSVNNVNYFVPTDDVKVITRKVPGRNLR